MKKEILNALLISKKRSKIAQMRYAAALLSLGTILSYVLGVLRDLLFSRYYGASGLTDAYFSAFLVSDICLMIFVASALLGSLTPIYVREKNKEKSHGLLVFGNFYTYIPGVFLLVSFFGVLFAHQIFPFFFPHLYAQYPVEFIQLGQMFFLSNAFFAFSNVLGNFLMSEKKFLSTAFSPLLYNIGIIGGIVLGSSHFGILAAGMGGVFGAMMHLAIRIFEYMQLETKFPYPVFSFSPYLRELIGTMMFRWTTVALFPLMLVGMSRFAGMYSEGLYTLFLYSRNIISAPVAIFGVAFATACFSRLSHLQESGNPQEFVTYFFETIKKVLFWTIPTGIGVFFLGTPFLEYLYHLGKTPEEHTILLSLVLVLSIAIPFESINNVLSRTLNALSMGKVLVSSNLLFLVSVFAITFLVAHFTNFPSFAMAMGYTLGFIIQVSYTVFFLARQKIFKTHIQESSEVMKTFWASWWASGAMGVFLLSSSLVNFKEARYVHMDTIIGIPFESTYFINITTIIWIAYMLGAMLVFSLVLLFILKEKKLLRVIKRMM